MTGLPLQGEGLAVERLREALDEERAYSWAMRETLFRLGHHPVAKHQSPQQYDSESADACTIPACLAALQAEPSPETPGRICPSGHWRADGDAPCSICAAR